MVKLIVLGLGLLSNAIINSRDELIVCTRDKTSEINKNIKLIKEEIINKLGDKRVITNTPEDYSEVLKTYPDSVIINTVPTIDLNILETLLELNVPHLEFSSPAADSGAMSGYGYEKKIRQDKVNEYKNPKKISLQIGFINQIENYVGGLSAEKMMACWVIAYKKNLDPHIYSDILKELDEAQINALDKYLKEAESERWLNSGFTCTPTDNVNKFIDYLAENNFELPPQLVGKTIAMHSSQKFKRRYMIEVFDAILTGKKIPANDEPEFYGQDSAEKISEPVRLFNQYLPEYLRVTFDDVIEAFRKTDAFFFNSDIAVNMLAEYARIMYDKV